MKDGYFFVELVVGLVPVLGWILVHNWYFRRVTYFQDQVQHQDGRTVPAQSPRLLVGHLAEVYQSDNRLAAYHRFHEQLGEIVQIFWMWRPQVSVASLPMAHHILTTHQKNYRKFPPNKLIQRLYGSSVLTNHGDAWQQQRTLLQEVFSQQRVINFHPTFVDCAEQLAAQWLAQLETAGGSLRHDIYPDLIALFLDIIGQAAIGIKFGALQGDADDLVTSIRFILSQSIHPLHQFTSWWRYLPLPANRKLAKAFTTVDQFLYELIQKRRAAPHQDSSQADDLLDLLLRATELVEGDIPPLTDQEVRDNLLAIIVNGYETVATSTALALDLLARHPEHLSRVQAEVDRVFATAPLTAAQTTELPYLRAVIVESLRLCPPMAGLQRISIQSDVLAGWSIPAERAVGIPLLPLHLDAHYYGEQPAQFQPQRYLDSGQSGADRVSRGCPLKRFLGQGELSSIQLPLTFGDGARRCLGEIFALHEMTVVLAILLHRFTFQVQPGDEAEMELGKFGLFISMLPKRGVHLTLGKRQQVSKETALTVPEPL